MRVYFFAQSCDKSIAPGLLDIITHQFRLRKTTCTIHTHCMKTHLTFMKKYIQVSVTTDEKDVDPVSPRNKTDRVFLFNQHCQDHKIACLSPVGNPHTSQRIQFQLSEIKLGFGCLMSQQCAKYISGTNWHNFMCCFAEIELADPTKPKHIDTRLTSSGDDCRTSGTRQGLLMEYQYLRLRQT